MTQIHRMVDKNVPDIRVYFSREPLCELQEVGERGDGEEHGGVVEAALILRGTVLAAVKPYALTIMRAPCFSWEEIEPGILQLLGLLNSNEESLQGPPEPLGRYNPPEGLPGRS